MILNEFREVIKNNTEEMVKEINAYLMGIVGSASAQFRNEVYDFSWSSLTGEMKKYSYSYSKKDNAFVKIDTEVVKIVVTFPWNYDEIFSSSIISLLSSTFSGFKYTVSEIDQSLVSRDQRSGFLLFASS